MQACRSSRGLPWARDRWDQKWRSSPSSPKREEICNFSSIAHWLASDNISVFQERVSTSAEHMKCTAIKDENIKSVWVFDLQHPATGKLQYCYCTRLTLKPFDCRRSCWTCSVAIKVADVFILITTQKQNFIQVSKTFPGPGWNGLNAVFYWQKLV